MRRRNGGACRLGRERAAGVLKAEGYGGRPGSRTPMDDSSQGCWRMDCGSKGLLWTSRGVSAMRGAGAAARLAGLLALPSAPEAGRRGASASFFGGAGFTAGAAPVGLGGALAASFWRASLLSD